MSFWTKILLIYGAVGVTVSVPYTLLAGWSEVAYAWTAWICPIPVACLFGFWLNEGERLYPHLQPHKSIMHRGTVRSWTLVAYLCLPIILNGLSIAVGKLGYAEAAEWIFFFRYLSLPLVGIPVTFILLCLWFKRLGSPPFMDRLPPRE